MTQTMLRPLKDVAAEKGVTYSTLHRWCRSGVVPAQQIARVWLLDAQALAAVDRAIEAKKLLKGKRGG